ncbi:diaminopimelate decarboxylase [Erysipelothrix rhusiopathiae]|nr:diaminopimelate decarboxylase [Erysipelothrix rhusiopathiae]
MKIQTPYFLIDKKELEKNINTFSNALQKHWPNSIFSYSVKTNSLPWVLEYMKSKQIKAEVVSDEEYQLSKLCGFSDDEIVYNGPIKGISQLEQALNGKAIINIDSEKELAFILGNSDLVSDNIGLRINVPTRIFRNEDIGYEEDGFRFGFSDETGRLEHVINDLRLAGITQFGLHFHVNSVSRSNDVYASISKYAKEIINKYQLEPSYIDIGGGFFGGLPTKPSADSYIATIRSELEDVVDINKTVLIIEPGSAIIGSCVELYSSVLDVKETNSVEIVTTDASRLHIDPLWKKQNYFYRIEKKGNEALNSGKGKLICGYTCMDHDRIMKLDSGVSIAEGDQIIFEKVGAYSITLGGPFIRYYPKVLVKEENDFIIVRDEMNVSDYYTLHRSEKYRGIKNETK